MTKKLNNSDKIDIACKHNYEGSYLEYAGIGEFEGTEYESRVQHLVNELEWFDDLMCEWGDLADDDEDEGDTDA